MDAIAIVAMLVIAFLVGHTIRATSTKKRKPADEAPDIEKNDRKWEINKDKIEKLRAEIIQELKQNGRYEFDSSKGKRHEGLHLNNGELYELLSPFLRKGYFVLRSEFWFIYPNQYFEIKKHRGSYSSIWFVTEDELEHQL
nr:MAG TPA: hypothetical protein [Caudoviricetes sp.]